MAEEKRKRGKGFWVGALAALVIVAAVAGFWNVLRPIREAKHIEQMVNERYAWATEFTPAPDGAVAPERMEAFLRVRLRVFPHCAPLQSVLHEVLRLETIENEEDVPKPAKLQQAFHSFRRLFGAGPRFLRFINARNHALLAEQMGLGEYMYIYVLAYREELSADSRYHSLEESTVSDRAREDLTQILRNQLAALTGRGEPPSDADLAATADALRVQITALEDGRLAFPWQDSLPSAVEASLAPYADRLKDVYCEDLARPELLQKNKGLEFRG